MRKRLFLRAFFLILLVSLLPLGLLKASGQLITEEARPVRFENLNIANGLSQSTVWVILQDRQGFMWLGTDDGLNRYDGYAFQVYRHEAEDPGSLRSNGIRSLYEDKEGNLWVGTIDGLDRFDAATESFIHYGETAIDYENLDTGGILAMLEDDDGNFWVGTSGAGLGLLDRRTGNILRFTNNPDDQSSISGNYVSSLIQDHSGSIWVGTYNGLNLFDRATRKFTRFIHQSTTPNSPGGNRIRSLFQDSAGTVWISSDDGGLSRYESFGSRFTQVPIGDNSQYGTNSSTITQVIEDGQGYLWIGTRRGLDRMNRMNGSFMHFRHDPGEPNSFSNDFVLSLYLDRSGVVWAGTSGGGVSKYNRYASKFQLYQHSPSLSNSLSNDRVFAIYEDSNSILWVGTQDGGLNRLDRKTGQIQVFQNSLGDAASISSNDVRTILRDSYNNLWVGTSDGLNRMDESSNTFAHFKVSPSYSSSISDNDVTLLFEDSQRNLWVGTRTGGLNLYNRQDGSFMHFINEAENSTSLSDNYVRSMWEDDEGYLWIGTFSGLNRMHPVSHRVKRYRHNPRNPNSLNSDNILSIYQDSRGVLWVGTLLGGLNRFDWETETFKHYTESDGLSNDTVYGILEDRSGKLWVSTNKGLSEFDSSAETFRNYDVQDGLQSNEFNSGAYFKNQAGELFFGGVNGLNIFNPGSLEINPNPPPVVVTAYKEYNQTQRENLGPDALIELPYSVNFISFEFVALDYNAPAKNQYAYMLEGFDKDWVFAGTRRYVNYTNLKGGDYVFRVRGSNNDGIWNEAGTTVRIHVIPPFWQSWWFVGLMAVGLGALVWVGYYVRVKSVESLNRGLEQQVHERTTEIERRREVAEGLRDIIAILNSNRSLEESLDYIMSQVTRLMGAEVALLFQKVGEHNVATIASNLKALPDFQNDIFVPNWIAERVMRGETVSVADLEAYQKHRPEAGRFPLQGPCSVIAVPMSIGAGPDGGLMLIFKESHIFSDEDLKTAFTFADQAALAIANAQLRARAEELAVTAERSRLARDLHDAVTQTLFATSIIAEVLPKIWDRNPDEGRKRLMEVRELTRGALAEMRTLLMELRPSALLDAPLPDLLQQLSDAFQGRVRIPVDLQAEEGEKLPPEAQVVFYRIAQESLSNIAKHARAQHVSLTFLNHNQDVRLEIRDDGVGFDVHAIPGDHFGLAIMKERAQTIGAQYEIESSPTQGTYTRLIWQRADGSTSAAHEPQMDEQPQI